MESITLIDPAEEVLSVMACSRQLSVIAELLSEQGYVDDEGYG